MRILIVILATAALAGCGTQPAGDRAATPPPASGAGETGTQAVTADAPQPVPELTDQRLVYECPKCGMDFDRAGPCSMDGAVLAAMQVSYSCPKDGQAVERAGKCPRCPMNAHVEKTAMAATTAPEKN